MELTDEQRAIVQSTGNIKINAVAGSGKTTTLLEYAKSRQSSSRILYVAFNKSVRIEAIQRFGAHGVGNATVETAHSLAFKHIVPRFGYKVRLRGYKPYEVAEALGLTDGTGSSRFLLANHIGKLVTYFCNSIAPQVRDLRYIEMVRDPKARAFVEKNYDTIENQARIFLGKMDKGDIEVTHDFYLKKFHLTNPHLNFDIVLLDEAQDLSPVIVDTFSRQRATKVLVGDAHQQIYSWRLAVNAIQQSDYASLSLSTSFRFGQNIADLASSILDWKGIIGDWQSVTIIGRGGPNGTNSKAVLARTNLGLLLNAIGFVTEIGKKSKVYFEGNLTSYAFAEDGTHLYDVLNLYQGKREDIKSAALQQMEHFDELEEYVDLAEDPQLRMMVEIVKTYKARIPKLMKELKDKHIGDEGKSSADMIFSTVHKSKGLEYDTVNIVDDFVNPTQMIDGSRTHENGWGIERLSEEINLLYVAVTRARNVVMVPEGIVPDGIAQSVNVRIVKQGSVTKLDTAGRGAGDISPKGSKAEETRRAGSRPPQSRPAESHTPWTPEQDHEVASMYRNGVRVAILAKHFARTQGAIRSRLRKLGVEP